MNRSLLAATIATAALLGASEVYAQTVLYTAPRAAMSDNTPQPLGQFIANRLTDADAHQFKIWLASSDVKGNYDVEKGYTVFAVVDSAFDPAKPAHPVEHYIVNQRIGLTLMQGNQDNATALNGDTIRLSRNGNSYYADGMRVNGVIKNPEGSIYLIGGSTSAQNI